MTTWPENGVMWQSKVVPRHFYAIPKAVWCQYRSRCFFWNWLGLWNGLVRCTIIIALTKLLSFYKTLNVTSTFLCQITLMVWQVLKTFMSISRNEPLVSSCIFLFKLLDLWVVPTVKFFKVNIVNDNVLIIKRAQAFSAVTCNTHRNYWRNENDE